MARANIPQELRALPLDHIIGSPMVAAIKAQALAAKTTVDFIKEVGLKEASDVDSVDEDTGYEEVCSITNGHKVCDPDVCQLWLIYKKLYNLE